MAQAPGASKTPAQHSSLLSQARNMLEPTRYPGNRSLTQLSQHWLRQQLFHEVIRRPVYL